LIAWILFERSFEFYVQWAMIHFPSTSWSPGTLSTFWIILQTYYCVGRIYFINRIVQRIDNSWCWTANRIQPIRISFGACLYYCRIIIQTDCALECSKFSKCERKPLVIIKYFSTYKIHSINIFYILFLVIVIFINLYVLLI
jgi:hypothetical protein